LIIKERQMKGVFEIQLQPHEDERGFFMRSYDEDIFNEKGIHRNWVQENHSLSVQKGTIRGMHFQRSTHAETKLVRVVTGELFDAFIDLRKDSPTFGHWDSIILSGENKKAIYIPRGFAHGTCSLTDNVHITYKVDSYYAPESEGTIKWDDPTVGIQWPIKDPHLSEKDLSANSFLDFVEEYVGADV